MPKDKVERRMSRQGSPSRYDDIGRGNMLFMTADLVPTFNGQDKMYTVTRWIQDIDDNAEIFGWTPLQQLLVARRSLSGTAALWLRAERPHKSWEDLKSAISKEFSDAVDIKTIHETMSARKKQGNESCFDYMLIMKELGKRGKMPDYVAIKYIIEGIQDVEINKSMLYGVTSYTDLREKLKIYEAVRDKMSKSEMRSSRVASNILNKRNTCSHAAAYNIRCYNCGEKGNHRSEDCPHKSQGTKCFKCNQFGHIAPNCSNPAKMAARENPAATRSGKIENSKKCSFLTSMNDAERNENESAERTNYLEVGTTDEQDGATQDGGEHFSVKNVNKGKILKPMMNIKMCGSDTKALVDSGSEVNLMSSDYFVEIGSPQCQNDKIILTGLGAMKVVTIGSLKTSIEIDGYNYDGVKFYVIPKDAIPYKLILGQDFLHNVTMLMNDGCVKFLPEGEEWMSKISCVSECANVVVLDHVTNSTVKKEVLQCVENYKPIHTKESPLQLKIILKDDIPVAQRPRRLSLAEQQIVEQQISEWLANKIIQVSYSEYSSPLVLVKKKDDSVRICVDYRLLNRKIVKDEFPLPVIDDLIDKLVDAKVYSILDLKNGFFHLKISEESVPYTSFVTHQGQYEFLRAPFGLSICPKYFMRFVSIVFRELIAQGIMLIFIDDILILAKDEFQAVQRLKQVLEVASQYGLQINWKKANLICHEIEFLGHVIKEGEVKPSPEKTDAVARYPEPKTLKQLHSFIGLTSYFRKYIQDYAIIAKPLTDLLKKNSTFEFKEEQHQAFHILKTKLTTPPVLKIYNPKLKTELHTDASSVAFSAILLQHHEHGLHPVHYMSRKTNEIQSKYSSYELEALAIIEGVKKFRHYLYGIEFTIVTDCQAFELTLRKKDLTPKVARWVLFLNEYNFKVEHRAGSKMPHADALSRYPCIALITTLHDDLKQAQNNDDGLKAIKEILKQRPYQDYWIDNEILYKGGEKKLVVPKVMEKQIIKRLHSNGHFSRKKMKELITKDYYIKDIDRKIEEFIMGCIPCLLSMRKSGKQEGFLSPIEKDSIPLDTLHLDHIGPLTETRKQYNYILTMIDAFTKFVWLFPTKTTSSSETLNKLKMHQQTFGNPRRIITDRGTAFTSNDFQSYCEEENIQHIKITTGVPRGNGQVERIHRIMIPTLTKLCIENQGLWFRHVSRLQRCLNSTFQRSITTTPFELMVGTKMRCKEDIEIINLLKKEVVEQYNEKREEQRKLAKEQILKIQEENQKGYNKKRKESTKYELGDLVAIKRTQYGAGLKLKAKYLGPYKVIKIKSNDRYDLEKVDCSTEGPNRTASSSDQMKRWPGLEDVWSE